MGVSEFQLGGEKIGSQPNEFYIETLLMYEKMYEVQSQMISYKTVVYSINKSLVDESA